MADSVLVGRIGRAHGLRGDVTVQPVTDSPEQRFAPGSSLRSGAGAILTVQRHRWQSGSLILTFEGTTDRSSAEALRGTELWAEASLAEPTDAEEFHDTSLIGAAVTDTEGRLRGRVVRVDHLPAQDLLVVDTDAGERLVPFVVELVPHVDAAAGEIVVRAIPGLLEDLDAD